MITAFLFFTKIIDGRKSGIDWGKFLVSRFMRLVPLYLFAISIMFIIVAYLSKGTFNEPVFAVFKNAVKWLIFTVLGGPDLNGINGTAIILAGVTWSLPYEWFFYLALPALTLTTMISVPIPYLIISGVGMLAFAIHGLSTAILMTFLGGIAASLLVRNITFCRVARTKTSSAIILACIITTISFYSTAYSPVPILLLSIAFSLIAAGNTLFTTLNRPSSRALGEMAYGIYLLHGIVLFITFTFAMGIPAVKEMSQLNYWLLISCLTPALILLCFATFRLIESPAMRRSEKVSAWLRTRVTIANTRSVGLVKVPI
jgi:peptidoglycan/LPS O-acetylase OafA/YrhL